MRSRAQLAAIFASLRGKGPIGRARTLRKKGVLKFGKTPFATKKILTQGGYREAAAASIGLKRPKGARSAGVLGGVGYYRSK